MCYHITQRKINIQKETSTSINIFSIASFLSMVALLAHLHSDRSDYPIPPIYQYVRMALDYWQGARGQQESGLVNQPGATGGEL